MAIVLAAESMTRQGHESSRTGERESVTGVTDTAVDPNPDSAELDREPKRAGLVAVAADVVDEVTRSGRTNY